MRIPLLSWALLAVPLVAFGAPSTGTLSSSEHPLGTTPAPQRGGRPMACAPGRKTPTPSRRARCPNVETQCEFTQQFHCVVA